MSNNEGKYGQLTAAEFLLQNLTFSGEQPNIPWHQLRTFYAGFLQAARFQWPTWKMIKKHSRVH